MRKLDQLMGPSSSPSTTGNCSDTPAGPTPKPPIGPPASDDYYDRIRYPFSDKASCQRCGDAGWVRTGRFLDDRSAEIVPCRCRYEQAKEVDRRLVYLSKTPTEFQEATFANFTQVMGTAEAIKGGKAFADGKYRTLVLFGGTGVGKTHLAVAAARTRAAKESAPFFFLNVPTFLDRLRATYSLGRTERQAADTEAQAMEPAMTWPIAIIDDLGAQRETEWAMERLYVIIDARYSGGLKTIVTSNIEPIEWEPRIWSRLCDRRHSLVRKIVAGDFRKGGGA